MSPPSVSPLVEVSGVLRNFGRCFGYPLRVSSDGRRVNFSSCALLYTTLPGLLKVLPVVAFALYLGREGVELKLDQLRGIVTSLGLSLLDVGSQFFLILMTALSVVFHVVATVNSRQQLMDLCDHMEAISHYFPAKVIAIRCRQLGLKVVKMVSAFACAFTILIFLCWNQFFDDLVESGDLTVRILGLVVLTFQAILGFFSPVVAAAEYLSMYLIHYLAEHFEDWERRLKMDETIGKNSEKGAMVRSGSNGQKTEGPPPAWPCCTSLLLQLETSVDLQAHLKMGLQLCKGVQLLNEVVGRPLLTIFLTNSASAILTTYGSVTILFSKQHTSSLTPALFSFTHLCLTLMFLIRLYRITSAGQRLIASLNRSRTALEDYVVNNAARLFGNEESVRDYGREFTVDVLRNRLDGTRGGISPLSFFTLSKVGFASGVGTILTYIIVLMQFKASE